MIRPTKYLDLNTCVLNISAHIVAILRSAGSMKHDELLKRLQKRTSDVVRFEYLFALDFLYVLGQIEYDSELDAIELVQNDSFEV